MPRIDAMNGISAVSSGPILTTKRDGGGNDSDFIQSKLKYCYERSLAVSRNGSLAFRGLKKIVQKGMGEKLDKVV